MVYVLNQANEPMMPCESVIARLLLKEKKAKVVKKTPFTIKMLIPTTEYKQPVVAGMDTGSSKVGCAAVANGHVIYAAEVTIRDDVSRKMKQRANYRKGRRSRKLRHRPARWNNRAASRRNGRLAPSLTSKLESHLREKKQVEALLPITSWIVETANFDIHKITNPAVAGVEYQEGSQQGFNNVKAYVLHRDWYKCQYKKAGVEHSRQLHVHHVVFRSQGGSDAPDNLIVLCSSCHDALHAGKIAIPDKKRSMTKTRAATHMGIIQARLKKANWKFTETFGYITKARRQQLGLPKAHVNDAVAICCPSGPVIPTCPVLYKRHVAAGDYRQTMGRRSEKKIPTGKLFGLRKFDLIKTTKGIGFVKGKRSIGFFAIADIADNVIVAAVSVKKNCARLQARSTTLVTLEPARVLS